MNCTLTFREKNIIDGETFFDNLWPYFGRINPYTNLEKFLELSVIATESLPITMRLKLLDFKKRGNDSGFLLIRNLKTDPAVSKTPIVAKDARNRKSYYSETWLSIMANMLGELFSYKQEGEGYLFHNVRPLKKNSDKLSSESSSILLDFHTETVFHPFIPDFLMLYCLRSDRNKQAQTIVSSSRKFIRHLDSVTIAELRKKQFRTGIDYSFGNTSQEVGNGPILAVFYGDNNDPLISFDPDLMKGLNKQAEQALKKLKKVVDKSKEGILLEPGDLLIVDNRRAVHGRNQFKAYYDDYDRWLQRTYVTRNLLQSEILFNRNERVIKYDFNNEQRKIVE